MKKPLKYDPALVELLSALEPYTAKEISERSKNLVGRTTIGNWRSGRTRRPQHYTMTAALAAIGLEYRILRPNTRKGA